MRVVIQRVNSASVSVNSQVVSTISNGLLLLIGFGLQDSETSLQPLIDKILKLRIFPGLNKDSSFDYSITEKSAQILVVSQFTLYADCNKGRRPSFSAALAPEEAKNLYNQFCNTLRKSYPDGYIAEGIFGADMKVTLENDGPVTILLEN